MQLRWLTKEGSRAMEELKFSKDDIGTRVKVHALTFRISALVYTCMYYAMGAYQAQPARQAYGPALTRLIDAGWRVVAGVLG